MSRIQRIQSVSLVVLAGFLLAGIQIYVAANYLELDYPYTTYLFRPAHKFWDFFIPYAIARDPYPAPGQLPHYTPGIEIGGTAMTAANVSGPAYFPVAYRIISLFTLLPPIPALALFLIFSILTFLILAQKHFQTANKLQTAQNVLVLTLMSYPILFLLDRGNFEILVFLCLYGFAILYESKPGWSAALLGIAIAMKATPALLLLLLLRDRRWKLTLLTILGVGLTTLAAYLSYPDGWRSLYHHYLNLTSSFSGYSIENNGLYFGHSLYGAIKFIVLWLMPTSDIEAFSRHFAIIYPLLSLSIAGLLLLWVWRSSVPFWQRLTILIGMMSLLPTVSADYKLIHFFIPLYLFINDPISTGRDRWYALAFGLLLIPKAFFHLQSLPEVNSGVLLTPIIILGLLATILLPKKEALSS